MNFLCRTKLKSSAYFLRACIISFNLKENNSTLIWCQASAQRGCGNQKMMLENFGGGPEFLMRGVDRTDEVFSHRSGVGACPVSSRHLV